MCVRGGESPTLVAVVDAVDLGPGKGEVSWRVFSLWSFRWIIACFDFSTPFVKVLRASRTVLQSFGLLRSRVRGAFMFFLDAEALP